MFRKIGHRVLLGALAGIAAVVTVGSSPASASPTSALTWTLPTQVNQLSFYQTIHAAEGKSAWYFGEQFNVGGQGAYTGLQPKGPGDTEGTIEVQAIFSVWSGVESKASHCSGNADGAAGSSCSKRFQLNTGEKYELRVENTGQRTWKGTVVGTESGQAIEVGWWKIKGEGKIAARNVAWTERYIDGYNCESIPDFDVTFGAPTGDNGAVKGTIGSAKDGSPCLGKQNWKSSTSPEGTRISVS